MPVNKSARYRYEVIDECLRNDKKKWTKIDLLNYVNRRLESHLGCETKVSASQLRYDLENMQSEYGAPIEMYRDGRSCYYRYEDPDFSIKSIPVDEEELIKLNNAVQLLQQIRGFSIADDIAGIVGRLENRYKYGAQAGQSIISFESAPEMDGVEHLEDIYQAIIRKNVLKISYQTFHEQEPRTWHFHPYLLKEYAHRWYLLGYMEEKGNAGVLALDRMKSIRVIKMAYRENSFIDSEDYFRDVIGVTMPHGSLAEEIELYFTPVTAPYIRTKPLHPSQRITAQGEDGSLQVILSLVINYELKNIIAGYGKEVKVLHPDSLAKEVMVAAAEAAAQYEQIMRNALA